MPLVSQTFDQLLDFTRTSSATFVGSNGLIQTTPASVNLFTQTQQFDNAVWNKEASTATANATTAPDGTSTADKVAATATTAFHSVRQFITGTVASYTYSVYAKASEYSKLILANATAGTWSATFDLATGATIATGGTAVLSSSIQSVGDGWYRCAVTFTGAAASTAHAAVGYPNTGATLNNFGAQYTGDGVSGIFLWGAQLEAASAASTYTRNNGGVFPPRFDYDPVTLAAKGLLIEEQRTNLFFQSQAFDLSPWTQGTNTVTANALASPDGTTNADLFTVTSTGTGAFSRQTSVVVATTAYTVSTFFKKGTADFANITVFDGADGNRYWFNLSTGAVASTAVVGAGYNSVSARIENYNNGWYRCIVTFTNKSSTSFNLFASFTDADASLTATNGKTGYLYGAQLEAGAFATSYIPTVASQVTRTADVCAIVAPNFAPWYNQSEGSFVAEFSGNGSYALAVNDGTNANYNAITYVGPTSVRGVTAVGATYQFVQMTGGAAGTVNKTAYAYTASQIAGSTNGGAVVSNAATVVPTGTQMLIGTFGGFGQLNGHIRSIRYFPVRLSNAQLQALTA